MTSPLIIGLVAGIISLNLLCVVFWCHIGRRRAIRIEAQGDKQQTNFKIARAAQRSTTEMPSNPRIKPPPIATGGKPITTRNSPQKSSGESYWAGVKRPSHSENFYLDEEVDGIYPRTPSPLSVNLHSFDRDSRSPEAGMWTPISSHSSTAAQILAVLNVPSLYRGGSAKSEETESVYSAASAPLEFHEPVLSVPQASDPTPASPVTPRTPTTPSIIPLLSRPLHHSKVVDGQLPFRRAAERSGYVWPKHRDIPARPQQVHCIKEELAPETYSKVRWRVASTPNPSDLVNSSVRVGLGTRTAIHYDQPPSPSTLAIGRQRSTSMLSLIPRGPLSGARLNTLLAVPENSSSATHTHRRSQSELPFLNINPAMPILPPPPPPFSPPIVNEPVRFSPFPARSTLRPNARLEQ